ncbi:MAG: aromatic ring-opening dioxygenase subunit LigA [Acidimicrobiales bacterium]
MSLYAVQKLLYELNKDRTLQESFKAGPEQVLDGRDLTGEERTAILQPDVGLLYVMGVNGQILMHFAAFSGQEWNTYIEAMREGVRAHGPVRDGIYAMTTEA